MATKTKDFFKALKKVKKICDRRKLKPIYDEFAGLKFHVESQDYFGTLATVLSLRRQAKQEIPESVIEDLMYLQRNYKIVKK